MAPTLPSDESVEPISEPTTGEPTARPEWLEDQNVRQHLNDAEPLSWWARYVPWMLALLLLLTLLVGLLLHLYYRTPDGEVSILQERGEIDRLWRVIDEKSQQCTAGNPTAGADQAPNTPSISPRDVETTLHEHGVTIGEQLNVSLVWSAPVDLDLSVVDPSGASISFSSRASPTGGTLDIDANASCRAFMTPPVENISWNSLPMPGNYTIRVNLYSACGYAPATVPFKLILTRKDTSEQIEGTVSALQKDFTHEFTVGSQ